LRSAFESAAAEYVSGPHDPEFVVRGHSENPRRFMAVGRELTRRMPEGGTLVDIGAGNGIVPRMMTKLGAGRVIVIDSERSGTTGVDMLTGTGIETVLATVGENPVPLPDGVADVVFAGDVIEHLPHTPRPFMAEIMRLLRPGGWHVQDTPNAVALRTRLKMLAGVSNWASLDGIWSPEYNVHHHKEYTLGELESLFARAGFETVTGIAYEHFWQKSLKKLGRLQTMGARTDEVSQFGRGFNPRHPYEYARLVCLGATSVSPSLRSSILVSGRKPA
jgi:2-polyprenyl-3-methyl-5-hydroxy-6-metoxy-1,4-benzoquinol methylase